MPQNWVNRAKSKEKMTPRGIVIHSTGRNQPFVKAFIQPVKDNPNYKELLKIIGRENNYKKPQHDYHFWVGKTITQGVKSFMIEPLDLKLWNDNFIHICICEDDLNNKNYLIDCISETTVLCDELCKHYHWTEKAIHDYSEISNFPDCNYWFKKHGYSVELIRAIIYNIQHPNNF